MTFIKSLLLSAIAAYKKGVSPLLPSACRFHPTCSQYAAEAIDEHGSAKGVALAIRRLTRCHPWHPGGFDPVPGGRGRGSQGARNPGSSSGRSMAA